MDDWTVLGHAYLPIPFYDGKVAKYQGMVTARNWDHLESLGCFFLPERIADRITIEADGAFLPFGEVAE